MNNDFNYDNYQGSNEVYPSYTEVNTFRTNNIDIKPPKKRRKWPIILLLILLLIVGVLIYLTYFTDKLDFIKPDDKYSEFDPNKGKIESNINEVSNVVSNNPSNSNKTSNSNSNKTSNSNVNKVVEKISITPTNPSVVVGSKITLKANITPSDAIDKSITWKSSDTKVATVNSKGVVTGVKAGTAIITATSKNGKKATVTVNITNKKIAVTGIYLHASSVVMDNQDTYKVGYSVFPTNATNQAVTFTSSKTGIAKVSSDGVITPTGVGQTTITVTTKDGNKSAQMTIFVKELDVQSISIKNIPSPLYIGDYAYLNIAYSPTTATEGKKITWTSGDTSIATINSNGKVVGIKEGNAVIKATSANGKITTATIKVRINPEIYRIRIIKVTITHGGYPLTYCMINLDKNEVSTTDFKNIIYNGKNYTDGGLGNISCSNVDTSITKGQFNSSGGYVVNNVPIIYSGF